MGPAGSRQRPAGRQRPSGRLGPTGSVLQVDAVVERLPARCVGRTVEDRVRRPDVDGAAALRCHRGVDDVAVHDEAVAARVRAPLRRSTGVRCPRRRRPRRRLGRGHEGDARAARRVADRGASGPDLDGPVPPRPPHADAVRPPVVPHGEQVQRCRTSSARSASKATGTLTIRAYAASTRLPHGCGNIPGGARRTTTRRSWTPSGSPLCTADSPALTSVSTDASRAATTSCGRGPASPIDAICPRPLVGTRTAQRPRRAPLPWV